MSLPPPNSLNCGPAFTGWRGTSGGPGTRRRRTSFRNFRRAAGRTSITTPWPSCGRSRTTNCRCACMEPRIPPPGAGGPAGFRRLPGGRRSWAREEPRNSPTARSPISRRNSAFTRPCPIAAGGLGILAGDHAKSRQRPGPGLCRNQPLLPRRLLSADHRSEQLADGVLLLAGSRRTCRWNRSSMRKGEPLRCNVEIASQQRLLRRLAGQCGALPGLSSRHQSWTRTSSIFGI